MEKKLKELFMLKIKASNKKEEDVSSYTIVRAGTGLFTMKIYWKGKSEKKSQTFINVKLNNDIEAMYNAAKAMESIILDGSLADIDFEQKTKTKKGDGSW